MNSLEAIIKNLTDRIRALETIQEGNGFVPYLFSALKGTNAMTTHGKHTVIPCIATSHAYIEITMPCQVDSLEESILLYIPTGTGTWDYTISTAGGYCGEDESNHTDSITADGVVVTDDELECLDISGALTPYKAGDVVGVDVYVDALSTTTVINVIGVRLR